jgi:hypothetical protein
MFRSVVTMLVLAGSLPGAAHAVSASLACQSNKNKIAGKYAYCRQKAEAKFAVTADAVVRAAALQKCVDKYAALWPIVEGKADAAGDPCPTTGDQASVQSFIDGATTSLADALAGAPSGLATGQRLETGQSACYDTTGTAISCAGTGQDGELLMGLTRQYVDDGNGTITDLRTGLTWEKLCDDGGVHDKDTFRTWTQAFAKVAALNGLAFAGHADWRLPNVNELQSLPDYGAVLPAVSPELNTACAAGCSVLTCSCTTSNFYWTSTTVATNKANAWIVGFDAGAVGAGSKASSYYVRAVRGGS